MKRLLFILTFMIFIIGTVTLSFANENSRKIFTPEEIQWLEDNPVIKVAPEDDYAPIEYYEDNDFTGLSREYLDWISNEYEITFEYVYYKTWSEILDALRKNEVDLQTAIVKTPDRTEYLNFTKEYVSVPNIVLVKDDFDARISIDELFQYKVGIIKDYAVHEYIRLVYTPDTLHEYTDITKALTDLSIGELDALILDLGQATYYTQNMAISNLTIADGVRIDFEYKLRFASPKDKKILISIMDKAIASIPTVERQVFYDEWVSLGEFSWFDKQVLNIVLGLFAIASVFFDNSPCLD